MARKQKSVYERIEEKLENIKETEKTLKTLNEPCQISRKMKLTRIDA